MIKVTEQEFQNLISEYYKGNRSVKFNLSEYEVIPDFELTGNKIIDMCLHVRQKDKGSILYYGGYTIGDCYSFQRLVNKNYKTTSLFVDGYRAVLTDNEAYNIYSYCEGDITVEVFNSIEDYQIGIAEAIEFYENN